MASPICLAGKLAIVTGATSGIGMATAKMFAANGARIVAVGRNEPVLRELADELG
jgi:NADP-dependent 3-hydroxy acid dehydrogenase YdfG